MKRTLLYLLILLIMLTSIGGCKKETVDPDPVILYPSEISAGQTLGTGIYYADIQDTSISFNYPSSQGEIVLDLNGDQVADFKLTFYGSASPGHSLAGSHLIPLNQNAIVVSPSNTDWADTLTEASTISSGLVWSSDTCLLYSFSNFYQGSSSSAGLWNNVNDRYIGTRITLNGNSLWGWIRFRISNGWNLTILEYACTEGYEL